MRAFAHDVFTYPLPAGHRFPLGKYRMVREAAVGLPDVDVHDTDAAGWDDLRRTHTADWVERVRDGRLERREQLGLGLPWSPELVERARRATGATILAARAALEDGVGSEPRRRDAPRVRGRRPRLLRLQRRRHRPARDAGRATGRPGARGRRGRPPGRRDARAARRGRDAPSRSRSTASATTRSAESRATSRSTFRTARPTTATSPRSTRRSRARSAAPGRSSASSSRAPTRSRATGSAASR